MVCEEVTSFSFKGGFDWGKGGTVLKMCAMTTDGGLKDMKVAGYPNGPRAMRYDTLCRKNCRHLNAAKRTQQSHENIAISLTSNSG